VSAAELRQAPALPVSSARSGDEAPSGRYAVAIGSNLPSTDIRALSASTVSFRRMPRHQWNETWRYNFSMESADIMTLCQESLDRLGDQPAAGRARREAAARRDRSGDLRRSEWAFCDVDLRRRRGRGLAYCDGAGPGPGGMLGTAGMLGADAPPAGRLAVAAGEADSAQPSVAQ
jgi:hypothetical protein